MPSVVAFDVFSAEVRSDPYAAYDELRAKDPAHRGPVGGTYLSRHTDVVAALRDPRLASSRPGGPPPEGASLSVPIAVFSRTMLSTDPPDHTRIRGLVARVFTPRMAERMRAFASDFVDAAIAPALDGDEIDIVETVAQPLPVAVVCEILGVGAEHRAQVASWSAGLSGLAEIGLLRAAIEEGNVATAAFVELLRGLLAAGEVPPGSLLHALAGHRDDGSLSDDELLGTAIHLLFAGHETSTSLLATGLHALTERPEQWAALRSHPSDHGIAVEELARYVSPVQLVTRWAREPIEVQGVHVPAGGLVVPLLGAANRDPEVFAQPDDLDLLRRPNPHVTFGHGVHFCLGAPLARLEVEVFLDRLLHTERDVVVVRPPAWRPHLTLRGVASLVITLT